MIGTLTLDQLRVLVAAAETGSFSAAGRQLSRVQSAVSQSIQALEAAQGVQLFDRTSRSPQLTEAGRILLAHARQVLEKAEIFESVAGHIAGGIEPELSIALDSFVPNEPFIASLRALMHVYPQVSVTVYTEGLGAARRRVRNQSAQLGFFVLVPASAPEFESFPLMTIQLVPVVAADHPLAKVKGEITREMLQAHTQLVLTDPLGTTGPNYSIVSAKIWRFVDVGQRLDYLLAGFGWANTPLHLAAPHLDSGRLVSLPINDPAIRTDGVPVFAVHERTRPPGPAGQWLLNDLRQRINNAGV